MSEEVSVISHGLMEESKVSSGFETDEISESSSMMLIAAVCQLRRWDLPLLTSWPNILVD